MEEELKEMLGKRPDELEGETLKLFNAIMKIADERDELKLKCKELKEIEESHRKENGKLRKRVKELEEKLDETLNANLALVQGNANSIPVSLVEEKIEELNKAYEYSKDENGESEYYYPDYAINILQELIEKER